MFISVAVLKNYDGEQGMLAKQMVISQSLSLLNENDGLFHDTSLVKISKCFVKLQ